MKKLSLLLLSFILFSSCNETEGIIYDSVNSQALVYFSSTTADLAIEIDSDGQLNLPINVSTLSTSDRTVFLSVETESSADAVNYSLPLSVVIPAGSYSGILTIDGTDVTAETTPKLLILSIVSVDFDKVVISSNKLEVSVFQICPIASTLFVGNYLIRELTPFVDGPTLDNGTIKMLSVVPGSATSRTFSTKNYPTYCGTSNPFRFNLVCGEIIVPSQNSVCSCNPVGGANFFTAATIPSTYNINDDSYFEVTFTNDAQTSCGAPVQTTYSFTKQ